MIEVGKADILEVSFFKSVETFLHTVGEYGGDTENLRTCFSEGIGNFDNATACGDEVFDDNNLLTCFELTLDTVLSAVILITGANVTHGHTENMSCDSRMSDTCCGCSHKNFSFGIMLTNNLRKCVFNIASYFGSGESESVVAIYGGFDPACPGKGFFGTEEYGFDFKKIFCDKCFCIHFYYILSFINLQNRQGIFRMLLRGSLLL